MTQRLLLALARHYFSAVLYFSDKKAQWLLFARGAQFLAMFENALSGAEEERWDVFRVCTGPTWLETK